MIKTNIDTTTLEGVAVEYYNKALKLAEELQAVGYEDLEIKKGDNSWCDHDLYLTVDNATFKVARDYKSNVIVSLYPYKYYSNVSSSKRSEVYKKTFTANNIKVITKNKIDNAIQQELQYHECLASLNDETLDTIQFFLSKIKQLEEQYTVEYQYKMDVFYSEEEKAHKYIKKEVTGGYIRKNGIEYSFSIDYSSGYIKEDIKVSYMYNDNKIDAFIALSDNKYIPTK
jgi:hypothetical protein